MTYDWFSMITTICIFIAIMIIFSRESADYVAYSVIGAGLSCIITYIRLQDPNFNIIDSIEWKPIIFILSMQIIVLIAERHKIFQWIAIKTLHFTKGNHRIFYYLICVISTFMAAIIADVTVSIIFVPLTIRACRLLKIDPAPYLYGITITINIGSIITPFSSSENILISQSFELSFAWFIINNGILVVFALVFTLFLLDLLMLRKIEPPLKERKNIMLEILDPNYVILDQKQFILNSIYFGSVILGFILLSEYSYLIALFAAVIMSLLNQDHFAENATKIDWKVLFFFISLFLIIGNMIANGTFSLIMEGLILIQSDNLLIMSIGVLIITSLLSGFLANSPTAIVGITIITQLYGESPPNLILIAFLLGINLGGNLLPQGAACDVMTLNLAIKHRVKGFTYKSLFKWGGLFALIHNLICIIYLIFYYFIFI